MAQAMRPDAEPKRKRGTTAEGRGYASLEEAQKQAQGRVGRCARNATTKAAKPRSGRAVGARPAGSKGGPRPPWWMPGLACQHPLLYAADRALRGHRNPIDAPTFT